jgi:phage terminase small subunit
MAKDELTAKERMFVEYFLGESFFNATDAARRAGYRHPNVQGPRMLVKVSIRDAVAARVGEAAMTANEVLARLTEIGRGKVTDFVDDDGKFDLEKARKAKKDGLLKKLKVKRTSKRVDRFEDGDGEQAETFETSLVYEEVEFEMYSAHEALRDLGKYHKLFTEKVEHSNPDGTPLMQPVADALLKAYGDGGKNS